MKSKWISEIHYLNSYIKWKTKEEIIEDFKNIKLWEDFIRDLVEVSKKLGKD